MPQARSRARSRPGVHNSLGHHHASGAITPITDVSGAVNVMVMGRIGMAVGMVMEVGVGLVVGMSHRVLLMAYKSRAHSHLALALLE